MTTGSNKKKLVRAFQAELGVKYTTALRIVDALPDAVVRRIVTNEVTIRQAVDADSNAARFME